MNNLLRIPAGLLLSLPLGIAQAVSPGVTSHQLSDIQQPDGDASGLIVSENGTTVCFVADQQTDEARELFCSATANPQTATRISGLLPTGSSATDIQLSEDGSLVYYLAPEVSGSKIELFRAPTDGSSPATRLNAPLVPATADVDHYQIIDDLQRVLYRADAEIAGEHGLYVVELAQPGVATKLSGPVAPGGSGVNSFSFDASTSRVYFDAEQQFSDREELYANDIAGGGMVKLSAPAQADDLIGTIYRVPGGANVLYTVRPAMGATDLWAVSATGSSAAWKVNQTLQSDGQATPVALAADGSRIVYVADVSVDGRYGLYSRALDGSEPQPVTIDGAVVQYPPMSISSLPRVVYVDDHELLFIDAYNNDNLGKLQRAAADGSSNPVVLSGTLDVVDYRAALDRDEALVIHSDNGNGVRNLALIRLDNSAITPLTSFNVNTGVTNPRSLDAARRYWVFQADPAVNKRRDVFVLDVETGIHEQRSGTGADLVAIERVSVAQVADDGWACFVEYRQNQMIPTLRKRMLRCTGINGVPGRDFAQVSTFQIGDAPEFGQVRPDHTSFDRVFFTADSQVVDQFEAYQADFASGLFADGFED
ncbi:MAG: hypothetical protein KDI75_08035 [Xanthomonadales bacterium]|nr:hypothetical protein [Xanthomonadales bacterium]